VTNNLAVELTNVTACYTVLDFIFKDGKTLKEKNIINWKIAIGPLQFPCTFNAMSEELGDGKYKLTQIRCIDYI
jgi:hypothetical protein